MSSAGGSCVGKIQARVLSFAMDHAMFREGERVLAGVSGGADSVCLLFILMGLKERLGFPLTAVHVHHGMRKSAETDLEFVVSLCGRVGVPCIVKRVDVPALQREWRSSAEEAARRARYQAFIEAGEECGAGVVATAHHIGDQAETVLLSLFRGAGLRGLSGMAPVSPMPYGGGMSVARPLLVVTRQETEDYLKAIGQAWRDDETNETDEYARNRVRHNVLSYARDHINVRSAEHIAAAADRAREAFSFIEEEAARAFDGDSDSIDCLTLQCAHIAVKKEILRMLCRRAGLVSELTEAHIEAMMALADGLRGSASMELPCGFVAKRTYEKLFVVRQTKTHCAEIDVSLRVFEAEAALNIPTDPFTKWFDYDTIQSEVCIRRRMPGDWIHVGNGRKSLKKELIDEKIPAGERATLTLLAAGDEILWIVGHRRCESHRVTDETRRILEASVGGGR